MATLTCSFGNLDEGATDDHDSDRMSNYSEFVAGTDPTDAADSLKLVSAEVPSGTTDVFVIQWKSAADKSYTVAASTNLAAGVWDPVSSNIPATEPINTVTVHAPGKAESFYKVEAAGQP